VVELGAGDADDLQFVRQQAVCMQVVERRQDHAPGEIAGGAEQDQPGCGGRHAATHERKGAAA
jgi:hypothetical protein